MKPQTLVDGEQAVIHLKFLKNWFVGLISKSGIRDNFISDD